MIVLERGAVTFQHKTKFNALTQLDGRQPRMQCVQHGYRLEGWERALRGIVFQPRYHQRSLSETPFNFNAIQEDHPEYRLSLLRSRSTNIGRKNSITKTDYYINWESDHKSDFYTRFKPMGCQDDIMNKVHDYMDFVSHPYTNPQPHDHRPVWEQGLQRAFPFSIL